MQTDPDEQMGRHRAKKNLKDFCKGKVDRPHVWRWRIPPGLAGRTRPACQPYGPLRRRDMPGKTWGPWWSCRHVLICENCGKQDPLFRKSKPPCPDNKQGLEQSWMSIFYWKQPANEDV